MEEIQTVLGYVLDSRRYKNVYVLVNSRSLFDHSWNLWEGHTIKPRLTLFGKSKTKYKCYVDWEEHPERKGKPVTTKEIRNILTAIRTAQEICRPDHSSQSNNRTEHTTASTVILTDTRQE